MKSILVVDDDEDVRFLVKTILEEEYTVHLASTWLEVNSIMFRQAVDLVLLDVNMPTIQGNKIVQALRKTPNGEKCKIILFSAMDEIELRKLVKSCQADGYMQKTFKEKSLMAKIEELL